MKLDYEKDLQTKLNYTILGKQKEIDELNEKLSQYTEQIKLADSLVQKNNEIDQLKQKLSQQGHLINMKDKDL